MIRLLELGRWQARFVRHWLLFGVVPFSLAESGWRACEARTWRVPEDAPTIQAGIDSALAGDDVLVAPGTYLEHDIDVTKAILVRSRDGSDVTIINGQELDSVFDVRSVAPSCTIEGFTILNGRQGRIGGGGGVACRNSTVTVKECLIRDCSASDSGGAILALESSVSVEDCRLVANTAGGGGGIAATSSDPVATLMVSNSQFLSNSASFGPGGGVWAGSVNVTMTDCLFAGNSDTFQMGAAVLLGIGNFGLLGCTLVDNSSLDGGTIVEFFEVESAVVERCLIASNIGRAIGCDDSGLSVRCTDTYGNTHGDEICGADLGSNFSADPLFCDLKGGEYTLDADSPCLPGQHPDGADCGLIGALGEGCGGSTPVETSSWGRIKELYRNR